MAIFRGEGGAGDSNTDATVTAVTEQATIATTKASEAADSATAAGISAQNAATSATASSTSSAASSTYAGEAASSANAAATSATNAATSATEASSSATAASLAETNAETAETNAETSESNAAASAATATTKATEAATSATSASTSASTATTKASEAATSASNAATSESNAATSATSAATSATASSSSATASATSASAASTSATNASTSATEAATSETNAATSATAAASSATDSANSATTATTQATNAATSASSASASAATATTKADEAATSATNAATSATTATTKASEASTSATNAATSETNAAASFDSFDDRYLGAKATAPTTDNDGDALLTGALYFDTSTESMKVWSGSSWLDAYATLSGALLATNNLSDLNNVTTSRSNLGLGTAAVTDSTAYATAAQGTTADAALPRTGGAMTGAITTNSTFDGRDVSADGTKLDGIEVNATADQTASEIKTAYESNANTNAFTDADHTKLDGIATNANNYVLPFTDNSTNWNTAYSWGDHGTEGYATQTYVGTQISNLVDSAPATLDTLNELAAALGDDPNFATTVTNSIATKLPLTGGTLTGNLNFGDNDKAVFGASSDLQIYHDGSNSFISDQGSGDLVVLGSNLKLRDSQGNDYVSMNDTGTGGTVFIKHSGNTKLATTSTGIDVTGTATMDGLTVDTGGTAVEFNHSATGPTLRFNNTDITVADGQQLARLEFSTDDAGITTDEVYLQLTGDGTGGAAFFDIMTGDGTPTKTARFNVGGDISFYEDTGTTAKFFWDASAESLGIGTSSPVTDLDVRNNISMGDGTSVTNLSMTRNSANYITASDAAGYLAFRTGGSTERARIDTSGNLLVGTTSTGIYNSSSNTGVQIDGANANIAIARSGGRPIDLNRLTSDGEIARFSKDGTAVGSIGVALSDNLYLSGVDAGIGCGTGTIYPATTTGQPSDNDTDLGTSSTRFKNLYLSGTVTATGGNSTNWNTAYGWGDHASAGYLPSSSYTAADVLTKIKTVDGSGSGLDADLLDGQQGSYYYPASNPNGYTNDQTASEILTAIKTVDGSGSGLDADLLDGLELHTGRNNVANRVVRTDVNGYIQAGWINTTSGQTSNTIAKIYGSYAGDNYLRWFAPSTIISQQGIWTSSNDGSGSGLDADLLDGIQGDSFLRSDVSDVYNGRVLGFGTAGNGANTSGAFLTIEGNTDGSGEGTGRLFFREHNSTTASADNYGMSLGYRGGSTSVTTASGNTWTGPAAIGNGEWGMWGHDNNATGSLVMHGPRNGSYVDFSNALVGGSQVWHAGNDGSGSGLDADKVDGLQASSFLRSDADDTMTGDLLMDSSNAEINIKSGTGGTSGAVNWTFSTTGTNYASIKLPYDTRASTGLWIDSGYPISIDATTRINFDISGVRKAAIDSSGHFTPEGRVYVQGSTTNYLSQGPYSSTNLGINFGNALFFYSGSTNLASFSTTTSNFTNQLIADKSAATTGTASSTIISRGSVVTTTGYNPQNYHITFQNGANVTKGSISSSHYATIYSTSSDYRLKEDLQPISNATERLLALNPVNFKWIDGQERSDGFIAHELQEHLPEAVTGEKDATTEVTETVVAEDGTETEVTTTVPEMQGIDQSKLVPLLVKTIQELEARIAALEE